MSEQPQESRPRAQDRTRSWNATDDPQVAPQAPSKSGRPKQRDPPPTLFLHPSPAASHVSLPGIFGQGNAPPPPQIQPSQHPQGTRQAPGVLQSSGGPNKLQRQAPDDAASSLDFNPQDRRQTRLLYPSESQRATDRTDALWAEMQATLEEVELSASSGTRVFGPDHERKLAELRAAQIGLAQAWARSEADDSASIADGDAHAVRNLKSVVDGSLAGGGTIPEGPRISAEDAENRSATGTASRPGSSGAAPGAGGPAGTAALGSERLGAKLEEETEADILLARKRREANDKYFQKISSGILDVVDRLEKVAVAMRAVEQESRDIWSEAESSSAPGNQQQDSAAA